MRSRYLQAFKELGGQATAKQIAEYMKERGHFSPSHLIHNSLQGLRHRGRLIYLGNATYKLNEESKEVDNGK